MSRPAQEPDRLPGRRVAASFVVSLAGVGACAWVALWLGGTAVAHPRPAPDPGGRVGEVEQSLVDGPARGWVERAAARATLDRYAWVDRDAGVAAIPIDEAMRLVAAKDGGR